jgi:hypothetical protein
MNWLADYLERLALWLLLMLGVVVPILKALGVQ